MPKPSTEFNGYWFDGLAELSTYVVEQERYGQMRQAYWNLHDNDDLSLRDSLQWHY